MNEKACKKCRLVLSGDACPVCGPEASLTREWEGYILLINTEGSEIAPAIGAAAPGKYALKILK
ncbi:hypothetical protein COX86_01760 [Candidatus Micrarchaeota archaeon CG_4_10_14_0_2_um_filter_60_11]|nr:MAG: hypothetical protein AUJ16_03580 [Candidatus Micrarchaeota archaeon CG1_02_60_51]PIN95822.1 MAG: hypothetical protein COU39_03890 [Candidatus Micrarchaeota archaeon CG10_big_fil_rev_8_21_14_0_10_60_32]PIO01938.1 MAG: hypothetical protein COT58_02575 [Candidatus Micrarchaeota archaeon CG09_land_8_20_14_0_10_60_16]PIY91977.1 MAG: hypothetical protein COY71_00275 [Candidatus Micrarchaeota archaeon CG_4_10_14_0_8_um_filter_60_7]PIZ91047.1 MAG: hypothetical protein COX86_01760 [Candidatus Mi